MELGLLLKQHSPESACKSQLLTTTAVKALKQICLSSVAADKVGEVARRLPQDKIGSCPEAAFIVPKRGSGANGACKQRSVRLP